MFKEILVIDDNPDIRFLVCNILEEQNFKVRTAANYDQAVLEINKRLPDLAIVDIKLDKPDKDGIDLLKLIIKKNKNTPVIMISGHATVKVAVEAIRLGAYEFIEKPFTKEKIINYLKKQNIFCRSLWKPICVTKPYKKNIKKFKNTNQIYKNIFWLPSSLSLKERDQKKICNLINSFFKNKYYN